MNDLSKEKSNDLEKAYFDSIKELREGEIVKGSIISITAQEVIVDIGYKSEGVILRNEFEDLDLEALKDIEVYIENVEDEEGKVILSYKKAKEIKGWQILLNNYKEGDLVEGTVLRKVKGGFMVDILGVEAFLPQSISMFKPEEHQEVVGKKFNFCIVKLTNNKESIIISRKEALKLERELSRKKILEEIEVGKILKGKVKGITNFGAFIDLGGVDGLLHIGDMSWKKINHPSEVVAVGDEINVMVLGFDENKNKISLGLKQTMPDPWKEIEEKYKPGSIIKARVTNIQNYGVFVEIEKGIEGLVHISEVSWTKKFINLNEMFAIGDIIEVKVLNVDSAERKISLSIKQLEKDIWEEIEKSINIDTEIKAKVIGFGENCTYLELENGLEGIIYNEDISWTKRVVRPQEIFKKSHNYDFKILGIDKTNRRIILGRKQLIENPWPKIVERYPIGRIVEGEIVKITSFGVFVKLEEDLEGLIFINEIEKEKLSTFKIGERIKVKIIKIDPSAAKIGLSAKIDEDRT